MRSVSNNRASVSEFVIEAYVLRAPVTKQGALTEWLLVSASRQIVGHFCTLTITAGASLPVVVCSSLYQLLSPRPPRSRVWYPWHVARRGRARSRRGKGGVCEIRSVDVF